MARSGSNSSRFPIVLIVAAVLAAIVVPIVLVGPERGRPPDTQPPGVRAVPGEIRTVPQLEPARKSELIRQMGEVLETLYARAFLTDGPEPTPAPEATSTPAATPATPVDDLFTDKARTALRTDPDVFRPLPGVRVTAGRISFAGIVTLEGAEPLQALFEVRFEASGTPRGPATTEVRLRQSGTLLLVLRSNGWQVAGFSLRFVSRPAPTPTLQAP